jgi:hypothetical protein
MMAYVYILSVQERFNVTPEDCEATELHEARRPHHQAALSRTPVDVGEAKWQPKTSHHIYFYSSQLRADSKPSVK